NDAEREGKQEHAGIEMDLRDARQRRRREGQQSIKAPARQQHAGHSAANSEDDALGEQLPNQPAASGAESRANGNLAGTRRRASKQKIREVRTVDEQDAADRAE